MPTKTLAKGRTTFVGRARNARNPKDKNNRNNQKHRDPFINSKSHWESYSNQDHKEKQESEVLSPAEIPLGLNRP